VLSLPQTASLSKVRVLGIRSSPYLSRLTFRPFRLQPPQVHATAIAFTRYFTVAACHVYPPGRLLQSVGSCRRVTRVRALQGASPTGTRPNRVHFTLRTGLSLQVALHLPSQERSYHCQLQAGNDGLRGTSTLQIKRLHRRTCRHAPRAVAHFQRITRWPTDTASRRMKRHASTLTFRC
jgi:hypothetical protein